MSPSSRHSSSGDGLRLFAGAVAVVTGAASGIGLAVARALCRRGAEVVLADLDLEPAEQEAAALRRAGGRAAAAPLDVRDFGAFRTLVESTAERCGRLDFLFNNAGIAIGGEVRDYRIEHWNRVLEVNLGGVVHGIQAAYPLMLRQGFGHLINTASMAGLMATPGGVSYAAAKHGVVGLSRSLRVEAARYGVRVSALCPGAVRTAILVDAGRHGEMLQPVPREIQEKTWNRLRPIDPDVFAGRVLRAVAVNRGIIVVPAWWRLFWWTNRLSPALGDLVARWLFERTLKELWGEPGAVP